MTSDHFVLERRGIEWFERVTPGCVAPAISRASIVLLPWTAPYLRSAWALADMLVSSGWGKCGLYPDDLYFDEVTGRDRRDWFRASRALGVPSEAVQDLDGGW